MQKHHDADKTSFPVSLPNCAQLLASPAVHVNLMLLVEQIIGRQSVGAG